MINLACGVIRISIKCSCVEIFDQQESFKLDMIDFACGVIRISDNVLALRYSINKVTPIRNISFSSPTHVRSHNPLVGSPASSLAHSPNVVEPHNPPSLSVQCPCWHTVQGSYIIYNNPIPSLANIDRFCPIISSSTSPFLKCIY